jgi:hypothetical protein
MKKLGIVRPGAESYGSGVKPGPNDSAIRKF